MPISIQRPNISHVSLMFQAMAVQLGYDMNDNHNELVNYPMAMNYIPVVVRVHWPFQFLPLSVTRGNCVSSTNKQINTCCVSFR